MASIPNSIAGVDLTVQQGDTWSLTVTFKNADQTDNAYDFAGATVKMQARVNYADKTAVLTLSSQESTGDHIVVDNANGSVTMKATAATMASVKAGDYVYDVECTFADGTVKKLIKGSYSVEAEVTRV